MNINNVLKEAKKLAIPSKEEQAKVNRIVKEVLGKVNGELKKQRISAKLIVGGSVAKGTWLPNIRDIDLFMLFNPKKYASLDISKIAEKVLNKRLKITINKKELEAVLGHEMSHLKHRDVAVITLISVIPMICLFLARGMLFSSDRKGGAAVIGIAAFAFYFITNLLVLYGSRIREYYADAGSVALGNEPHYLASALYKLVHGSAKANPIALKQVEGMKAFFANDVSRAHDEIREIAHLDLDKSGHIDEHELAQMKGKHIKLGFFSKAMEVMSTHPNMLKRIKALSELK